MTTDRSMVLARTDFIRFGPDADPQRAPRKEWQHFVVYRGGRRVIVNFSVGEEERPGSSGRALTARMIVLVEHEGWTGAIEQIATDDVDVAVDGLRIRLGGNELRLDGGVYRVDLDLPEAGVRGRLVLIPTTKPFMVGNHRLGRTGRVSWLVVPRLEANGWLTVDGARLAFRADPAYHDHNWGRFRWGEDFAWEWATVVPDDPGQPWAITFMRQTDRSRHTTLGSGLFVWHGPEMVATFRDATTSVGSRGLLRRPPALTLPPVARLAAPGHASGIPAELTVEGERGQDRVRLRITPDDHVRLVIPSETTLGRTTTLNEITARIEADGTVAGRRLRFGGYGVVELLG